jgi:hypothetical protein
MGKEEITWIELINTHIKTRKADGKPAGVRDVMGDAKTDWTLIKADKHPKYSKGTSKGRKTKKHGKKRGKRARKHGSKKHSKSMKVMIKNCKLCSKCSKEIKRALKKMNGGDGGEDDEE